jgi:hypothetical protein
LYIQKSIVIRVDTPKHEFNITPSSRNRSIFCTAERTDKKLHACSTRFDFKYDDGITEAWKYRMPFYCYKEKMLCYLWLNKKNNLPYIGIVDGKKINHPDLIIEKRSRMKIMLLDPQKDLPIRKINSVLKEALAIRNGVKNALPRS